MYNIDKNKKQLPGEEINEGLNTSLAKKRITIFLLNENPHNLCTVYITVTLYVSYDQLALERKIHKGDKNKLKTRKLKEFGGKSIILTVERTN